MTFMRALRVAVKAGQTLSVGFSLYQAAITLAGYARRQAPFAPALPDADGTTFGIVICARNEAPVIGGILDDLRRQDYPADLYHVTVVAHNCTDETARVAACHGARVVVLDDGRIGKVAPMSAALATLPFADYAGVFDADARIPSGYLTGVAAAAAGRDALQIETVPATPHTQLEAAYGFGRAARNALWWRPRARLGLGTTLTGSGFFVRPALIESLLPQLRTGTDDLEMTTRLALAGTSVAFVDSVHASVEEPAAFGPSISQRSRWVRGHMGTIRRTWPQLMARGLRGDLRAFDLAMFLIVPTRVITRTGVGLALLIRFLSPVSSIAALPILLAAAAETIIPVAVCAHAGLLTFNRKGLGTVVEHGVLGFLWFPIGIWSLLTARRFRWEAIPRQARVHSTTDGVSE